MKRTVDVQCLRLSPGPCEGVHLDMAIAIAEGLRKTENCATSPSIL
jgi:hypothetical protein